MGRARLPPSPAPLLCPQECEQLQKLYGGQMDERTLEKTQQQHMLYQQEQHHQILQQQIQVGSPRPLQAAGPGLWRRSAGPTLRPRVVIERLRASPSASFLPPRQSQLTVISPFSGLDLLSSAVPASSSARGKSADAAHPPAPEVMAPTGPALKNIN